jgi:hypothetical protein
VGHFEKGRASFRWRSFAAAGLTVWSAYLRLGSLRGLQMTDWLKYIVWTVAVLLIIALLTLFLPHESMP